MIKHSIHFIATSLFSFSIFITPIMSQAENSPALESPQKHHNTINYDKFTDQLQLVVKDLSLKQLLSRLAQKSGIEFLFDDNAEDTVSISLPSSNIEHGLKNILRGKNYSLRYDKSEDQKQILTGVMILPKNVTDPRNARRLLSMEREGINHATKEMTLEQFNQIDAAKERWQTRLDRLPPERRKALEERITKRVVARQKIEDRRNKKQKENEGRRNRMAARLNEKREAMLHHLSPEERAAHEQRGNEARDEMRAQLQQQLETK